jgi:hypothetical protein
MKSQDSTTFDPRTDVLLSYADIAARWSDVHVKTVQKRLKMFKVPPVRLSKRMVMFRLSDIVKLEEDCQ